MMTSKEAFEKIIEVCRYYHRGISNVDCKTVCGYPIKNIERDLEVLEIIKKWTFIIQENYKDSYRKFTQFICSIHTIEMEEDFKKVKEWLEEWNCTN